MYNQDLVRQNSQQMIKDKDNLSRIIEAGKENIPWEINMQLTYFPSFYMC